MPKSATSRRRSRLRGTVVLRKSTTSVRPCWRMSMPVELSDRSTTRRPSPLRPRRKSTSRSACCDLAGLRLGEALHASRVPGRIASWSFSVTTTVLPSTCVSNDCGLLRLNTTRVRLPAWITLRLRRAASSTGALRRAEAVGGVEEVERDARRARDGEARRRIGRRALELEAHHDAAGARARDGRRRRGCSSACAAAAPASAACGERRPARPPNLVARRSRSG